ncbi:hypothetical protein TrVGV298_005661 [Trichoderma virens]|nr:hypothetical protein TrVGV298_005661 [Trichoderma virens]
MNASPIRTYDPSPKTLSHLLPFATSSISHKVSGIMNESTWESASTTTTGSADDCDTPTLSTMSDPINFKDDDKSSTFTIPSGEHHPKNGRHFMIRERQHPHRILSLRLGEIILTDQQCPALGWLWMCVKKSGWYGFQNAVSGTYLGHNGRNKIHAAMPHHKSHEYFMAERHENGGYVLLTRHGEELWQVAISEDGDYLVEQKEAGTAWDFVESSTLYVG